MLQIPSFALHRKHIMQYNTAIEYKLPISPTLNKVSGHSGDINPYTTPATPEVAKKINIGHLHKITKN